LTFELFRGDGRRQTAVIGEAGPGGKARDGNRGGRHAGKDVGDLLQEREQPRHRDGGEARLLWHLYLIAI